MSDYRFTLTLTLQTPVLSQSVGALGFGYDMSTLKDGKVPVLPGSLIRGNLRDALRRFADTLADNQHPEDADALREKIRAWFGPEAPKTSNSHFGGKSPDVDRISAAHPASTPENCCPKPDDKDDYQPRPAQFNFDYYWRCQPFAHAALPRNRIRLNPKTGIVEQGALIVIDAAGAADHRALTFAGSITARLDGAQQAEDARRWLEKAAQFLPAVGSLKGVGYGKVLSATVETQPLPEPAAAPLPKSTDRIGLRLTLDRPFCLAQPRAPESNLFSGEESIAGAALKAVLARQLGKDEIESLHFDELVFTHALPAKEDALARWPVLPKSLAWVGDAWNKDETQPTNKDKTQPIKENLLDLARLDVDEDKAAFVCERTGKAAKFQVDWKHGKFGEFKAARQLIDTVPECDRHLAVHTAINPETGQSDESRLFSLDCVDTQYKDKNGDTQTMAWCADIDLSAVDAKVRPQVAAKLVKALARPLVGLGKTKAIATVAVQPRPFFEETELEPLDGCFIVTLQTPALMCTDAQAQKIQASGGGDALRRCYEAYWNTVSGGSLKLKRYFAAQQRRGGAFVWHHYLKHPDSPDQTYRPFWLTEGGSVFVLTVEEGRLEKAKECLDDWRKLGLPQPDGKPGHGQWRHNPYLRENGFGEIRVNDPIHTDYNKEEKWL